MRPHAEIQRSAEHCIGALKMFDDHLLEVQNCRLGRTIDYDPKKAREGRERKETVKKDRLDEQMRHQVRKAVSERKLPFLCFGKKSNKDKANARCKPE